MDVYLDNAATTALDPEVLEAMLPYMRALCGNPSSIHSHGRRAKVAVEKARKCVATLLNVSPAEVFFTASGTEGNNMALWGSVAASSIDHVITSSIEHHAVLQPLEKMRQAGQIQLHWVRVDAQGNLQYDHLEYLLKTNERVLVSLMHANNEIGNLNDLARIGALCQTYGAIFHTDAVQTIGHCMLDFQTLPVHLAVGSAHKFHGPQGVGLIYIRSGTQVSPIIDGGAQERNMRGGTEHVPGIVGLGKALEIAHRDMQRDHQYIQGLKDHMIQRLQTCIPGVVFHGTSAHAEASLYTILSVSLPPSDSHDMLVFNLDIQKISASVGSACTSGSHVGSHVLQALGIDQRRGAVRFSFSKYNTAEEIDYVVEQLRMLSGAPAQYKSR
ncbi:MAG: cysteine desulfurase [Amoebophilaceae bacterium]|jgi:cysteine desulfurase|nr:cysteine desulfurase [Amoebophilaceae bacterium]